MITQGFDLPILEWIRQNLQCHFLDVLMPGITHLGDGGIFWILTAIALLCFTRYRRTGIAMAAALLIGLIVCNLMLKPLVARIRPFDYQFLHYGQQIPLLIPAPTDFSFPSGHTIASVESAAVLLSRSRKLGIPAVCLAAVIAFSRLYLYVHYPTDVLASIILGIGIAFLATYMTNKGCALYEKQYHKNI